ncbi:MAG: hypothetical protein O3A46_02655 [Candidatus Poribacteria bacterium]|nr:hypothetical protein [Candidatus Poribacteria bacterium]
MSANPFGDAMEELLSFLPKDVLTHLAGAKREFLLTVKTSVEYLVDEFVTEIDERVDGANRRREGRSQPSEDHRVDIEDDPSDEGAHDEKEA